MEYNHLKNGWMSGCCVVAFDVVVLMFLVTTSTHPLLFVDVRLVQIYSNVS